MDDGFAMGYALGQDSGGNRGNGGMFGSNDSWIWIIVVFALLFGWGNNGNGNGQGANNGNGGGCGMPAYIPYPVGGIGFQNALTRADLCSEFNFNNLDRSVAGIQQGLCDGFYAQNSALMNGFHGVDNAICSLGNSMQQGFNATQMAMMQGQNAIQTQISDCCCKTNSNIERGFADVGYRMATDTCALQTSMANNTRDIIDSQNAGTRAILDYLTQQEAANLRAENQSLKLAASQAQQNAAIGAMISASEATILRRTGAECPTAAYVVQPPTPVNFPTNCCGQFTGWNNGCGCNSGCGC